METTNNFQAGLKTAYDELNREGKLSAQDQKVVGQLLDNPIVYRPGGERIFAMRRAHRRIRRYYARQNNVPLGITIDWTAIVEWIKEHWVDIVKILLSLLIFI